VLLLFQNRSELTSHLSRIARDLTDDIALKFNVISRAIQRDAHGSTYALGSDDPWHSNVASVASCHDLPAAPLSDAPFGRACRINDSLKFATARETGRFADTSTLR